MTPDPHLSPSAFRHLVGFMLLPLALCGALYATALCWGGRG